MRFTRNRTMWIHKLFDTVATEFDRLSKAYGAQIEHTFLVGDKIVIKQFLNHSALPAEVANGQISISKVQAKHANLQTLHETSKALSSATVFYEPN